LSNCLNNHSRPAFHTYDTICNHSYDESYVRNRKIFNLTQKCFELYFPRLKRISNQIYNEGVAEYFKSNSLILNSVLKHNPSKVSLSVTLDESIHYVFRFRENYSLFIETFLNLDDTNDTFFELYKDNNLVFSIKDSLKNGLNHFSDNISDTYDLRSKSKRSYACSE